MSTLLAVFPAAWEPSTKVHASARYILAWSAGDVGRWLAAVNFGELSAPFEAAAVDGTRLLELSDETAAPLEPKAGRRATLLGLIAALRQGFVAWTPDDVLAWLAAHEVG